VSSATSAVFNLVRRDFAPLADRLRSVIARERQIPMLLATGNASRLPRRANSHTFFTLPAVMSTLNLPLLSSSWKCLRSAARSLSISTAVEPEASLPSS